MMRYACVGLFQGKPRLCLRVRFYVDGQSTSVAFWIYAFVNGDFVGICCKWSI